MPRLDRSPLPTGGAVDRGTVARGVEDVPPVKERRHREIVLRCFSGALDELAGACRLRPLDQGESPILAGELVDPAKVALDHGASSLRQQGDLLGDRDRIWVEDLGPLQGEVLEHRGLLEVLPEEMRLHLPHEGGRRVRRSGHRSTPAADRPKAEARRDATSISDGSVHARSRSRDSSYEQLVPAEIAVIHIAER